MLAKTRPPCSLSIDLRRFNHTPWDQAHARERVYDLALSSINMSHGLLRSVNRNTHPSGRKLADIALIQ